MALTTRLDLRQSQSLVMTPQLQQAIKLLQLSNLELAAFIESEIEQNPLLEHDEGGEGENAPEGEGEADESDPAGARGEDADTDAESDRVEEWSPESLQLAAREAKPEHGNGAADGDDESDWDGADFAFASWGAGGSTDFSTNTADIEETLQGEKTLRDHLFDQLNVDVADPADRVIGSHLIEMLDEAGYLAGDLEQVAGRLNCPLERVEATLARLQSFDPPGIFARSLAECLALQLRDRDRLDPAMQALIDHLDLLGRHDHKALMKVCGVDAEDLADMIAEVRALDPKPALAFDHSVAQTVTPDVLMRPRPGGGGWIVELNTDTLPRVLVNTRYYAELNRGARSKTDKEYISDCFQSANWLVKSLHQRATTILRVASEIVRQQEPFFARGVQHLRPLILRDIAGAIDMHESTVSRVTTNKYILTPRGTFELKYFFTSSIPGAAGGDAHSAEAVRHRIKALVDGESADAVLSDDRIVEILRADGVDIARRTVAKYREALGIPSSIQRRRRKAVRV